MCRSSFEERFGRRYALTLLPNREIRESVFQTFDDTFAVTYALQLIAVTVAAVGHLRHSARLCFWSVGASWRFLRATGASRGQVQRWILLEFGLIGLLSWALSLGAGALLAWQLIFVINRQFFGWTIAPALPPQSRCKRWPSPSPPRFSPASSLASRRPRRPDALAAGRVRLRQKRR
jgi:putative ABC transport system permease protein